jgi:hypothetical protein
MKKVIKMKRNNILIIVTLLLTTLGLMQCKSTSTPSCCVIAAPEINLTGNRTVVERQIVGDYKELEKDSWIISSVKTTIQKTKGSGTMTAADRELFLSMKVREFHLERINGYKKDGALGENNLGLVEYRKTAKFEEESKAKEILENIIKNENEARRTIFQRTLFKMKKKEPDNKEIEAFGRLFAGEQRALAGKNEWIQEDSGRWIKK